MTRGSEWFEAVAEEAEVLLAARHQLVVPGEAVDAVINQHLDRVAQLMGVSPRAAVRYAPPDLAAIVAGEIATAAREHPGGPHS